MRLRERRALITGAASGIGRATAVRFAEEGCSVAVTGRRADRISDTAAEARERGVEAVTLQCDHTSSEDNQRCVREAVERLGGIDILVNNAGVFDLEGILEPDPVRWRRVLDTNLEAVYDLTHRVVAHLGEGASILNVSSVCGYRPYAGVLSYCVSKAALDMFTKCLALELAPRKIRVNSINPGVVVTELHTVTNVIPEYDAFLERAKTTHPLGRVGQPEEVAALAVFLASDEAGWITGGIHPIDGGRALTSVR
jgi:NAD(P)-dependent dehydrogenase (short-subunit alcohol dehydrogenase family)